MIIGGRIIRTIGRGNLWVAARWHMMVVPILARPSSAVCVGHVRRAAGSAVWVCAGVTHGRVQELVHLEHTRYEYVINRKVRGNATFILFLLTADKQSNTEVHHINTGCLYSIYNVTFRPILRDFSLHATLYYVKRRLAYNVQNVFLRELNLICQLMSMTYAGQYWFFSYPNLYVHLRSSRGKRHV